MHGHLAIPLRPPHLHNSSSSPTHHDRRHLPSLRTCSQTDALLILLPRGPARSGPTTTSPPGRVRLASSLYDISALEPLENTERLARIVWCRVRVEGHWREEVEEDEGGGGDWELVRRGEPPVPVELGSGLRREVEAVASDHGGVRNGGSEDRADSQVGLVWPSGESWLMLWFRTLARSFFRNRIVRHHVLGLTIGFLQD